MKIDCRECGGDGRSAEGTPEGACTTCKGTGKEEVPPAPLDIFNWAVVRQSTLGPAVRRCAETFDISPEQVRELVAKWDDPRGNMECLRIAMNGWRIDAYYNTSGG